MKTLRALLNWEFYLFTATVVATEMKNKKLQSSVQLLEV